MELLQELSFANTQSINCPLNRSGIIKILASGELAAGGRDRGLIIRFNRNADPESYQSFTHMGGHDGTPEWAHNMMPREEGFDTGICTGRNGWYLDATFMLEYTLSINPNFLKVTGSGLSSFALGDNRFLGYEGHGVFVTNTPVSEIEVGFTGGAVRTGDLRIYHM